ncbi:MAG TPA: hypothetical protein VMF90_14325 [Rhizobiaceae bacterium]|nr:hypothetical protein [Rhizobiaceae bacterium]
MTRITSILRNSAAALSLAAAAFSATPALAEKASLKEFSFSASNSQGVIRVISSDKQKWDTLKSGTTPFSAHMNVQTRHPGAVVGVAVTLGECAGAGFGCGEVLWSDSFAKRDYEDTEMVVLPANKIAVSGTGITLGDQIIARCNEQLQADGPTKSYSFTHELPITFVADTEKVWGNIDNYPIEASAYWPILPNQKDHHKLDMLEVNVICEPVVKPAADDLAFDHGEFDVESVRLFTTTYQSAVPGSNAGTVCPALKATARAETNKAGAVQMRLWHQKDDGPITSKLVDAWSSYDAQENKYYARYHEFVDVGTTSTHQFLVEVTSEGPWGPQDGWKDITVHCTSPGGGGLTTEPQDNDAFPTPQASWTGDLIIADSASAGGDKSCPRSGQVFFEVTRPEPGDFNYRIQCSNGAYFEGTATGYDQGSGIFEAYGAHDISISRTRDIQCTLQEMTPAPVTVAKKKEGFTCANPTFPPATDDITSDTRPTEQEPVKPVIVIDPVKPVPPVSILCKKGFELKGTTCVRKPVIVEACDEDEVRGKNGKCIKKPGVSIHCLPGFEQIGKKCVKRPVIVQACEKGEHRVNGKCVDKPTVSIFCKKGFKLMGKTCVKQTVVSTICPMGQKNVRGNCVPKEPTKKIGSLTTKKKVEQKLILNKKVIKGLKLKPAKKRRAQ